MKKNFILLVITCLIFHAAWCSAVEPVVVSVVFPSDVKAYRHAWNGFREYLSEKKVSLQVTEYNIKKEKPDLIFSQIKHENPNIVVTLGTKASKLAKEKINSIPVVFCMVFKPREIASSNVTGVSMEISNRIKLQGVKRILPHTQKIGLIYSATSIRAYEKISYLCKQMGFKLIGKKVDSQKGLPDALKSIIRDIDCFFMISDSKIYSPHSVKHLLLQSLREKFPVVGLSFHYTKAGALFSYDCDYNDLGRQSAKIALRILNSENPADIKPLAPTKTRLFLNQVAAERLGIKIPPEILKEASGVFGQ